MMTSLTDVAITTRKIIRYGVFAIVALITARIIIGAVVTIYRKIFPAPPPKPTISFGKLPKLPFRQTAHPTGITFPLETASGTLPKLAPQAKVFFMPKLSANLLSLSTAKDKAGGLNFKPESVQKVSETIYRFSHKNAPATLEVNIVSGIFSISYDLKTDPSPLNTKPPVPEIAASLARSYLSSANLLPADLTGPVVHEFLKLQESKLITALSLSESNLIKINLFRKNYDHLPVMTPDPNNGNVWFILSGTTEREKQIIAAQYHYFPVDESQFSTYPLITSEVAWSQFSSGNFYLANIGANKENDNIKIRKIYLAYYDAGVQTDFLQPIIILEGDKGFMAYIPAVTSDYYGE